MEEFEDRAPRQELIVSAPNALEQISRAEVDVQISTAKRFPRVEREIPEKIRTTALRNREAAHEMFYALTRGKGDKAKPILGPSIRFAEIVAMKWGNLRIQTRVMDVGREDVTVCAIAHDLETNVAVSSEVKRRITTRDGGRYSNDMIIVTSNAASAIAFRNVVFKVVPKNIWEACYKEAMDMAAGKGDDLAKTRDKAIEWFKGRGVTLEKILSKLGRSSVADIDQEDIIILRGLVTSIKEETSTVDEIFGNGDSQGVKKTINLGRAVEEPPEPGSNG
jgi:hypothetical protein